MVQFQKDPDKMDLGAVAPEMYEFLEWLRDVVPPATFEPEGAHYDYIGRQIKRRLLALLAKAEGRV